LRLEPASRRRIAAFISIYGAYAPSMDLSSHTLFADGPYGPSRQLMMWCWNLYAPHLSGEERQQVSPLGVSIGDFPPTLCIGAECDLLIDALALRPLPTAPTWSVDLARRHRRLHVGMVVA
jgi:acetyl esterase/lipase